MPSWLKDTRGKSRPINARSETVSQKPFFRSPWRHHRCLLPADGFYEWRPPPEGEGHGPKGKKQPYWIRRQDGAPFWLGGLWDHWIGPDGSELQTCCILTTTPNALLRPIHDRMPVVINDGWEEAWLLPEASTELRGLEALMPRGIPPAGRRFQSTGCDLQTCSGYRWMKRCPTLRYSIPKLLV